MKRLILLFLVSAFIGNVSASPLGCLIDYFTKNGVPRHVSIDGLTHLFT